MSESAPLDSSPSAPMTDASVTRRSSGDGALDLHHTGTPESVWLAAEEWDVVPVLDLARLVAGRTRVVILSAHPDDETLGLGGTVAILATHGLPMVVIVLSAGENSHPRATAWTGQQIAAVRRREVAAAVSRLAHEATLLQLDFPDGGIPAAEREVAAAISDLLEPGDLLLAPWWADGHTDHDAAGRAAAAAVDQVGCRVAYYPVWLWHWATPREMPWDAVGMIELTPQAQAVKQQAITSFASQLQPLGPLPGDQALLAPEVAARFNRLVETLILERPEEYATVPQPGLASRFDAMYDNDPNDPWGFTDSFYEQRKRRLTLAVLGRQRYHHTLEIGCANGVLTAELAERTDTLVAMDVSPRALTAAQARAPRDRIQWLLGEAPQDLPSGPFDLVAISEVGYFLTPSALLATLRRVRQELQPGGEVVLVHWRHPPQTSPCLETPSTSRPISSSTFHDGSPTGTRMSRSTCGVNRCPSPTCAVALNRENERYGTDRRHYSARHCPCDGGHRVGAVR